MASCDQKVDKVLLEDQKVDTVLLEDLKKSKYANVLNVVFKNHGAVFGGFLRDFFAKKTPSDIDVAISYLYFHTFDNEIKTLGYTNTHVNQSDQLYTYTNEKQIKIEVIQVEDNPHDTKLGPCPDPDYDVNLLAFNGKDLYNWMDDTITIASILANIEKKVAIAILPQPDRIAKMVAKGYEIGS